MSLLGRLGAFVAGGLLGAGVGAAVAALVAPQSGDEFRDEIERKVEQAKVAGLEAQARMEEELIRRFRAETGDPEALRDEATQVRVEAAQAIADLGRAASAQAGANAPDA
jgi:gas vesicle protein